MELREWLVLFLTCVAAIAGLLIAASAEGEGNTYALGLGLFVAAVIYGFLFLKWHFDRLERVSH